MTPGPNLRRIQRLNHARLSLGGTCAISLLRHATTASATAFEPASQSYSSCLAADFGLDFVTRALHTSRRWRRAAPHVAGTATA